MSEQIQISGTVEDVDRDDCDFSWTFLQGATSAMQPIVTVLSTSPTRKWQVTGVHAPLPVGNYQVTITAREKNTADHKQTSATVLVTVTNGGGGNPPQTGPPEYSTTESGCVDNTSPTLSFSPNVELAKPIYTAGSPVSITFSGTDSSSIPSPINPNLVWTGTVVEWTDLSQLTALGVTPQTTPSTMDPTIRQKSYSTLTFTAPNHTGTIYLKAKATDVFGCSKTATFGIGFQATSATAPTARIRYKIGTNGTFTEASGPVTLTSTGSSQSVIFDASTSVNALTYAWTKEQTLTAGSVTPIGSATLPTYNLTVSGSARGTVVVRLTAKNGACS